MSDTYDDIAIVTTGPDFTIDMVNSGYTSFAGKWGLAGGDTPVFGQPFTSIFPESFREDAASRLQTLTSQDETWSKSRGQNAIINLETANGKFIAQVSSLIGLPGEERGYIFLLSTNELNKSLESTGEGSLSSLMDGMGDAVIIVDESCSITYMNKITKDTFGSPMIGTKFHSAFSGNDSLCPRCNIKYFDKGDVSKELESKNGAFFLATFSPVVEKDGRKSVIGVLKNITFRKRMEEELRNLTITDNLTGLYNKRHFMERVETEMSRAERQGHKLSLIFADVDSFKEYNDNYGHMEGDLLLSWLGKILSSTLRASVDGAFRYGGDEFTILLPEASAKDAARVGERIMDAFRKNIFTVVKDGRTGSVSVSLSMGIAEFTKGQSAMELIHNADRAMYRAKKVGGGQVLISS